MKKFLLLAAIALVASSANAQISNRGLKAAKARTTKVAGLQTKVQKFEVSPAKAGVKSAHTGNPVNLSKTGMLNLSNIASVSRNLAAAPRKAGEVLPQYKGTGLDASSSEFVSWTSYSGTFSDGSLALVDVIPNVFGFEDGVAVEYTLNGNTITIQPQQVASIESQGYYIFIDNYNDDNGVITLTIGDDGSLVSDGQLDIEYGVFSAPQFDPTFATYLGYYELVKNIHLVSPDAPPVAPTVVCYEPDNLILNTGIGPSGYSYQSRETGQPVGYSLIGAYAPVNFRNTSIDLAETWNWKVQSGDDVLESSQRNLTLNTEGGASYSNIALTGANGNAVSDPYLWGVGRNWTEQTLLAGGFDSEFEFTDGTHSLLTRFNPDAGLKFYTNWATPDIYTNASIHSIVSYQGKPSSPLYMTGVTLPFVSFTDKGNFSLTVKIQKITRTANGAMTLGDVIAQADATSENAQSYDSGLTVVTFDNLYVEDEDGLSETVDYLFIDEEFAIVIEGFDNGTFSGVLGCEDECDDNNLFSTWFDLTGAEGSWRRYTTWKTALFIGLEGATYGYLHTNESTDIKFGANGGQAVLNVEPMLRSIDAQGNASTRLWDDDNNEEYTWLKYGYTNEVYTDSESSFDLVVEADPLPEGVSQREAKVVLWQEGARLVLNIVQKGAGDPVVFDFAAAGQAGETVTKVNLNFQVNMGEGKEDRTDRNFRGYQNYTGTVLPATCQVAIGEEQKFDAEGLIVNQDRYLSVYDLKTDDVVRVIYTGVPEGKAVTYCPGLSVDTKATINGNELVTGVSPVESGQPITIKEAGELNYIILSIFKGMHISRVIIAEDEATGIAEVKAVELNDGSVYNLAGQRVSTLLPGQIYVKNGRKFMVK